MLENHYFGLTENLKEAIATKIVQHQKKVSEFRTVHGKNVIGQITVDMIYGGMRSMKGLVCETSLLDPIEGIRFRGYSIPECRTHLPKTIGSEPAPEGIFWLLCTGDIPTSKQVAAVTDEWNNRAVIPEHVVSLIQNFPRHLHPMAQLVSAVSALSSESKFSKAYNAVIKKSFYWEYIYEDSMDLLAKLPTIAALIYQNTFKNNSTVAAVDPKLDWAGNLTRMLGYESNEFSDLMRLYLCIHSDHEGGNVSAHASHLVGSALSDPYLCFAAGMTGLAGPLHGLANQEVLMFLQKIKADLNHSYTEQSLKDWLNRYLNSGQVIPGYGHAVLRKTDPRFVVQHEFALKNLPNDPWVKLVADLYKIVPEMLKAVGKVQNPYPNVDAHSGVLLMHYGMKEMSFYTLLFGVSRAMGLTSQMIWDRGMGQPLERPKSLTTDELIRITACN
ncbi:unnamed protein product [Soboliphyme baturini]|uniref:Citrate synthase n=1 Tax=Soboliphyme baturini TaxID=241478 RepID=A0A183IGG7_9BILA|nr:unnamed protein product [Soboliphyme baturini]